MSFLLKPSIGFDINKCGECALQGGTHRGLETRCSSRRDSSTGWQLRMILTLNHRSNPSQDVLGNCGVSLLDLLRQMQTEEL